MLTSHDVERAARLAADLVNLGTGRVDRSDPDAPTLSGHLAERGLAHDHRTLAAAQDDLVAFAEAVRPAFAAGADAAAVVNRLLGQVQVRPRLVAHDDRPAHLHFEAPGARPHERLIVNSLLGLAGLLGADPERLGTCVADGCEVVFVDTSRNGRRRFCTQRCANRSHVAAHRARARA